MSLDVYLGSHTKLNSPLLDGGQMDKLGEVLLTIHSIDLTFEVNEGSADSHIANAREVLNRIRERAFDAASNGRAILLSDRTVSERRAAVPVLLADVTELRSALPIAEGPSFMKL